VPGVCRTLARIELTGVLERQLALELLERALLVTAGQVNEAEQPVQGDCAEPGSAHRRAGLWRKARSELALGLIQDLPRDVDRGGEPVGQRKIRQKRERSVRGTEALLTPADVGQTKVMP